VAAGAKVKVRLARMNLPLHHRHGLGSRSGRIECHNLLGLIDDGLWQCRQRFGQILKRDPDSGLRSLKVSYRRRTGPRQTPSIISESCECLRVQDEDLVVSNRHPTSLFEAGKGLVDDMTRNVCHLAELCLGEVVRV
jgi:hypothetical protein